MKVSGKNPPRLPSDPTANQPESPEPRLKRKQRRMPEDSPPVGKNQPHVVFHADANVLPQAEDKDLETMSDEALIEELARGNHNAFAIGSERWRPHFTQLAWRFLRRPMDVHDAVQQTLLKIYLSHLQRCPCSGAAAGESSGAQSEYRFFGSFNAWTYTILRNVIVDMLRKGLYLGTSSITDYDIPDDREDVEHSILLDQMRRKCETLPAEEQELLFARMNGKTLAELAKEKHCAVSTMSAKVNSGIRHLRNALGVEKK